MSRSSLERFAHYHENFRIPPLNRRSVLVFAVLIFLGGCSLIPQKPVREPLTKTQTVAGAGDLRFGEVCGVVVDKN